MTIEILRRNILTIVNNYSLKQNPKIRSLCLLASACAALSGCAADEQQTAEPPIVQEITAKDIQDASEKEEPLAAAPAPNAAEPSADIPDREEAPQENFSDTQQTGDARSLYEQFLNGEISAAIRGSDEESEYAAPLFANGSSYTLAELEEHISEYYLDPEYTDKTSCDSVQYAYVGCLDSADADRQNLLVKFTGLNLYTQGDDSYAVLIVSEKDGQLYVTGNYECWARSETTAYTNGTLRSSGSGGAGDHYDELYVISADGQMKTICEGETLFGWWTSYVNDAIYNEIFGESSDSNLIMYIATVGDRKYYQYDLSECTEEEIPQCESYIDRCRDELGIQWVEAEEFQTAVQNQCSLLGVDYEAVEQQDMVSWQDVPAP